MRFVASCLSCMCSSVVWVKIDIIGARHASRTVSNAMEQFLNLVLFCKVCSEHSKG